MEEVKTNSDRTIPTSPTNLDDKHRQTDKTKFDGGHLPAPAKNFNVLDEAKFHDSRTTRKPTPISEHYIGLGACDCGRQRLWQGDGTVELAHELDAFDPPEGTLQPEDAMVGRYRGPRPIGARYKIKGECKR